MSRIRVAIHRSDKDYVHYSSWTIPWIQYCQDNGIDYEVINAYQNGSIEKLKNFNVLLMMFGGYSYKDIRFARNIIYTAKKMGLKVFPDFNESWHFDDKIAESILLDSIGAPIPKYWMFFSFDSLKDWANSYSEYPIVAKLKNGSGSNNVKLIRNSDQLIKYGKKMFGKGYDPAPSFLFKAKSNIKSAKTKDLFIKRMKLIPHFLRTLKFAKELPKERGYVYLQEFIPNDGYDLKIVVVGDKISYIGRKNRKGDFRASGGGDLVYDRNMVAQNVINSAFKVSDELKTQCIGFDYIVDSRTGQGVIVEMSYGFNHSALLNAGGYWDREGNWHNEPLNAPVEVLKSIVQSIEKISY